MVEEKVAMNLVKKALDNFNKVSSHEFPVLSISKRYYKRYNLEIGRWKRCTGQGTEAGGA